MYAQYECGKNNTDNLGGYLYCNLSYMTQSLSAIQVNWKMPE